jgi:purine nucleoside phosphorylase
MTTEAGALEEAVRTACAYLAKNDVPEPDALFLFGTGLMTIPGQMTGHRGIPLERVPGVPEAWRSSTRHAGDLDGCSVWLLVDDPGLPEQGSEAPTVRVKDWVRGFPCWLGAAAGAGVMLHTVGGFAVADRGQKPKVPAGTLGLVADHINVSGHTPLRGLGDSKLGPLFPDTSRLHHRELRERALSLCEERGLPASEVICACTLGPSQTTPAERTWLARAGADVAAQNLEGPLIAAAHAGLVALSVVCVTEAGTDDDTGIAGMIEQADRMAPALEELCSSLSPALTAAAAEQFVDE